MESFSADAAYTAVTTSATTAMNCASARRPRNVSRISVARANTSARTSEPKIRYSGWPKIDSQSLEYSWCSHASRMFTTTNAYTQLSDVSSSMRSVTWPWARSSRVSESTTAGPVAIPIAAASAARSGGTSISSSTANIAANASEASSTLVASSDGLRRSQPRSTRWPSWKRTTPIATSRTPRISPSICSVSTPPTWGPSRMPVAIQPKSRGKCSQRSTSSPAIAATSNRSAYHGSASAANGKDGRKKSSDRFAAPLRHDQHDLAGVAVGFHRLLRARKLAERENLLDQRPDAAVGDRRKNVRDESAHAACALLGIAQLVRHAEHLQALGMQRIQIDLGLQLAIHVSDDCQTPFERERAHAFCEHRAADRVDRDIHTAAAGCFEHGLAELAGASLQREIEAERL